MALVLAQQEYKSSSWLSSLWSDPEPVWDIPANSSEHYKAFASYFDGTNQEAERVVLEPRFADFDLPSWADGTLISSGPSYFKAGNRHFGHYMDGFGRFSRFDIKGGNVSFSSKMLQSEFYKDCMKKNTIVPGILFKEPTPARLRSNIPGVNLYYSIMYYGDNNWVSMEKLPGNGPYYVATDSDRRLVFNPSTLEPLGRLVYEDETGIC